MGKGGPHLRTMPLCLREARLCTSLLPGVACHRVAPYVPSAVVAQQWQRQQCHEQPKHEGMPAAAVFVSWARAPSVNTHQQNRSPLPGTGHQHASEQAHATCRMYDACVHRASMRQCIVAPAAATLVNFHAAQLTFAVYSD